ncbi:Rifampin ADP-ribosyl transferase (modular protein) [uncultured Sphingopyxis sp.]|uniref:Uncharacterized protein (DUF1810 family) n=2 Tax=Sphingopyxis TaxID=165697 RepID=A0A7W9B8I5_9SPHN|nr:uncharacterized protein (DUF1810 family) [Sphingopyxis panaciterrulae]SBV32613.1 Rifampin ADP-ribosyl transferase (modular protein) [uncultured Sphingopyxis sp.]
MSSGPELERFVAAQDRVYSRALDEIRRGAKRSHWMWFIFPQLAGLGRSAMAQHYAIADLGEAQAYLAHPLLGARYLECVEALQDLERSDPVAVFGAVDAVKLRSSLTLFELAGGSPLFGAALARWFDGERDEQTLELSSCRGREDVLDEGPFFHGTIAELRVGDFLSAGYRSNYRPEVVMNHIYFTALVDGAGLAAEIAAELAKSSAVPRVYSVEPTGPFENDPNVTDKKFPGNPTRSYRSSAPLKVTGEITDWARLTPEALQMWRERLTVLRSDKGGEIIN